MEVIRRVQNRIFDLSTVLFILVATFSVWPFLILPLWFHSTNGICKFYSLEISSKGYLNCCRQLLMVFLLPLIRNRYNPRQSFLKGNQINSFLLCAFTTSFCSTPDSWLFIYKTELLTRLLFLAWPPLHVSKYNFLRLCLWLYSKYFIQTQIKGFLVARQNINTFYQL